MLAYIALQRAGKGDLPIDLLWDLEAGKITLDFSDEEQEADASPPESAPAGEEEPSGKNGSSSLASSDGGDVLPEPIPQSSTGLPG